MLCASANELQLLEKTIFHKYWLFCSRDSSCLHLTFAAFCLLSVWQTIAKTTKLLRRPISASDRILDRFCVVSIEFLSQFLFPQNVPQRRWGKRNVCRSQGKRCRTCMTIVIALMHVYVTQANFTTKPRFEIKNKRSFTEMNSQGSRVEKNTHAQKVQMQKTLFTNEACWWNLLVWRNHA